MPNAVGKKLFWIACSNSRKSGPQPGTTCIRKPHLCCRDLANAGLNAAYEVG